MAVEGVKESAKTSDNASSTRASVASTYDNLMRQSRKLGRAATQTLGDAKHVFRPKVRHVPVLDDEVEELKKVVARSREVLSSKKTVLPFLFPHEVILDRTQITIIKRNFFWSSDAISIRIEDVLNVSACVGPLFGSVTVASRVMSTVDHFMIDRFWRDDAIELKEILQGYLIARHNGLHTDHLSREELIEAVLELGRDK